MQQLEMTIEGVKVRISLGAGNFRKGPAHHYFRAPRWTGLNRSLNGGGASVIMKCHMKFEFTLSGIHYVCDAIIKADNENQAFHPLVETRRQYSAAEPTDLGTAKAFQIAKAVAMKIKGDENLRSTLRDETLKDCIEQCKKMQQRLQAESQIWESLEAQIKEEGLKCR